jgi:hypothetical protein
MSGGDDLRPVTFTHGDFLSRQAGKPLESPRFFVYVHPALPDGDPDMGFEDDGRTAIRTLERDALQVHQFPAHLLSVEFRSRELPTRRVAILRVRAEPQQFVGAAESEGWEPNIFIGTEDGCGGFGANRGHCFNRLADAESSIPLRLNAVWWIADHFPNSTAAGGADPQDGGVIQSQDPDFPVTLKQLAFLSTKWRSRVSDQVRLHGGARLFEIVRSKPWSTRYYARYSTMHSPNVNRMLK